MDGICECQISHRRSNTYPGISNLWRLISDSFLLILTNTIFSALSLFSPSPPYALPSDSPLHSPSSSPSTSPHPPLDPLSRAVVVMSSRHTPRQSERDLRVHDSRPPPSLVHPHLNGTSQPPLNTTSVPPQSRNHASPAVSANGTAPISNVQKLAQANEQTWLLIGSDISLIRPLGRKTSV